jgi:capsular polysaccharide transport system ATP-binding protein
MTIEFINVTKKVRQGHVRLTYENLNIRVEPHAKMALLGHKEAGLESITSLICSADAPDKGRVLRTHSISWPIPSSQFLKKHLPLATSARFLARLYEVDPSGYIGRIAEMAQIGDHMNSRGDKCPKEAVSRFLFSAGLCLSFEQYIFTNLNAGGKDDRARFADLVKETAARAGLLFIGSDLKVAQQFCDEAYVFDGKSATYFDDMDAAAEFLGSIAKKGDDDEGEDFFDADPELESLVNMDF